MRRRQALALPALLLAGTAQAEDRLPVVASFTILADFARQIGGARVAVSSIAGPDADSHAFQPRPSHLQAVVDARLLIRNGLGFDPWFDRLVQAAGSRAPLVTASEGVTPLVMEAHDHDHDHGGAGRRRHHSVGPRRVADPHAWQDVRNAMLYADAIAAGLIAADPAGAAATRAALSAYRARLAALDAEIRAAIARVPEERRIVVTSHRAFGYFAAAYGVRMLAPRGVSTETEPSAREVAELIRFIRAERVTAVFLENISSPALLQRIAAETGARIGGRLYSDALSAEGGPAPSYEAMMRHNLGLLVPAMLGSAA
jgi:zinc/manganese transport system substrate-binding protein